VPELAEVEPLKLIFLQKGLASGRDDFQCTVVIPGGSSLPALADNEVASVGELNGVAIVGGREVDVAAGLVVLVVVLTTRKAVGIELEVGSISDSHWVSGRGGERADCG
jgi:hypothetical protein